MTEKEWHGIRERKWRINEKDYQKKLNKREKQSRDNYIHLFRYLWNITQFSMQFKNKDSHNKRITMEYIFGMPNFWVFSSYAPIMLIPYIVPNQVMHPTVNQ